MQLVPSNFGKEESHEEKRPVAVNRAAHSGPLSSQWSGRLGASGFNWEPTPVKHVGVDIYGTFQETIRPSACQGGFHACRCVLSLKCRNDLSDKRSPLQHSLVLAKGIAGPVLSSTPTTSTESEETSKLSTD